jgi:hypothetical protein
MAVTSFLKKRDSLLFIGAFALALLVMVIWSFSSPPGSSPDEGYHATSIWCAEGVGSATCPVSSDTAVEVPSVLVTMACHVSNMSTSAACVLPSGTSQSTLSPYPRAGINVVTHWYPNTFYRVMHLFTSQNAVASIIAMRIFNSLVALLMVFSVIALSPRSSRQAIATSWLVACIPLGFFIIASINPSSWTITGCGISWAAAYGCFESRSARRRAALGIIAIIALALAFASRTDGGAVAVIGLGMGALLSPNGRALARQKMTLSMIGIAVVAIAAIFYLTSTGQWKLLTHPLTVFTSSNFNSALLFSNFTELPQLWAGTMGSWGGIWGLGWFDVPMPAIVGVLGIAVFGATLCWGLADSFKAKTVALGLVGSAVTIMPLVFLQSGGNVVGQWVQPRYLLPGLLLFLGLALIRKNANSVFRLSESQVAFFVAALSITQAFALHRLIRRYETGITDTSFNLNAQTGWWWSSLPSPMTTWLIAALAFVVIAYIVFRETSRVPRNH